MDPEYDILGGYAPSFVEHLMDTGARLGLGMGSKVSEDCITAEDSVEDEVAKTRTLSRWTPAEYAAFFRGLSVHSRWRPDLIAACVPTRTAWEVGAYLDALEEGAVGLAMERASSEDVDMEGGFADGGRSSSSGALSDSGCGASEPALEVSQTWIDAEELMASWIVREEGLAGTRDDDGPSPKRKRGRPRGSGKKGPEPASTSTSTSACKRSPDPSTLRVRKRRRMENEHEVLMGRLEASHLLVMDLILREGEEATREQGKNREGSATGVIVTEHGHEGESRARDEGAPGPSDGMAVTPNVPSDTRIPSNAMIDPVLLGLSGGAYFAEGESTSTTCAPTLVHEQNRCTLANASQRASFGVPSQHGAPDIFAFPLDNTAMPDPDATANADSDLSSFSPRSRRRIQKRLYMRRKRALLRGSSAASEGDLETGVERLKPGKKTKSERCDTPAIPSSVACSEASSDAEMESTTNMTRKNIRGLTLPYKLKAQFARLGIDAAYLRDQGMDLLNLGTLGKLMGLYSSLEHGEEEADGSAIAQSIDAKLIQHLQAAVVSFVTDIVHRVVVWRERATRLKQRSRAWRHGDQITVSAVEHAMEAIGARHHNHKQYFKSLVSFCALSTEFLAVPEIASNEPNSVDTSDPGATTGPPLALSLHRDIYTPFICPPSAWRISSLNCLTQAYEREATRRRCGTSADVEEEELMSDETDEEALEAELEEEEEADRRDLQLAAKHEQNLWDKINN